MKLSIDIFLRGIGIYLLLTCPSVLLFLMYALSAFYAVTFGWLAWLIFYIVLTVCSMLALPLLVKWVLLLFAITAGVLSSYIIIGYLFYSMNVWEDDSFILFPAIAVLSGFISLFISRKKIILYINPMNHEEEIERIQV